MGDINSIVAETVTVKLDQEYRVRFSMKAFGLIAKRYGSVQEGLNRFFSKDNILNMTEEYLEVLLDFAEAGLACNEGMTRAKLEDIIDARNIIGLVTALRKAVALSVPQDGEEKKDPQ